MRNTCGIISHRGVCRVHPNDSRVGGNTIEAFEEGIRKLEEAGFSKSVEFDVRLTKDGIPAVIHYDFVDDNTNGHGQVRGYLFSELQKLDAGYGRKIPSLAEVLDHFKDRDVSFHIEFKEHGLSEIIRQHIFERGLAGKVVVSTFNDDDLDPLNKDPELSSRWSDLQTFQGIVPNTFLATAKKILHMGGPAPFVEEARRAGAYAIGPEESAVNEELVAIAHEAGLQVNVWVVNDPVTYKTLAGYGVDNVFCDNPDFLV